MSICSRQPPLDIASLTQPATRSEKRPSNGQTVAVSYSSACPHARVLTYHTASAGALPSACKPNAEGAPCSRGANKLKRSECRPTLEPIAPHRERGAQFGSPVLLAEARACRCVMANTYSFSRPWSSSPGHSWTSTVALSVHKSAPSRPLKSQSCWSAANLPLWYSPSHRCTRAADHLDGLGLVSSYAAPFASPPLSAWQTSSNMS